MMTHLFSLKPWFLVIFLLATLPLRGIAEVEVSGTAITNTANVNDTTNATFTVVSGVASKFIKVYGLVLSVETADNLTVKCASTTKLGPLYLGATSGLSRVFFPMRIRCGAGEALTVTKGSASTKVTAYTEYTQEY